MDKESVKEKFSKLTIWKRGGERAPHKPLLILYALGCMLQDKKRLIPYEKIDKELRQLLMDFGPDRASYHPEFPFWRLQNDQIWEVTNADDIELTASGDAKKSDLIRLNVQGGFSKTIFQMLQKDSKFCQDVIQELLYANFPETVHEDILQCVGIDIAALDMRKKRDTDFRQKVLRAYEYKCAVCGFDVRLGHSPIALEAAHIKWHQSGGPDIEVNGLALCALHHKLFDRGAFSLSEDLKIMVSDRVHGNEGFQEWLMRFHGKNLRSPQRTTYLPDQSFRKWHIREVFKGEFREL